MSVSLSNISTLSDICQLDGNDSFCDEGQDIQSQIPVHVSQGRPKTSNGVEKRIPVRKAIKRNNIILQGLKLPTVININPRSKYNKSEEFKILVD